MPKFTEMYCVFSVDAKDVRINKIMVKYGVRCLIDDKGQKYPRIDPATIDEADPCVAELIVKSGVRGGFDKGYRIYPLDCQTITERYEAQEQNKAFNDFRSDFLSQAFDQIRAMNFEQLKDLADILAQDKFKAQAE